MKYERITGQEWNENIDLTQELGYSCIYKRLYELENKIAQGTLIEQKTCKNISEMYPSDGFTCSECGITIIDYVEEVFDEEDYSVTRYEYAFKYCPNCGAKIKD